MQAIQGVDYFYLFSATFFLVGFLTPIMRRVAIKTLTTNEIQIQVLKRVT